MKTILNYVLEMPQRHSDALKFKKNNAWVSITWETYFQQITTAASSLLELGTAPGDRVAIMSNTRPEWCICDYAIMGLQAITIPIYQTSTAEDLEHILNNSEAKILFIEDKSILKIFRQVEKRCPNVKKVIMIDCNENVSDEKVLLWGQFQDLGEKHLPINKEKYIKLASSIPMTQTASILYTSGTTGLPKGVVLTHEQIMSEVGEAFPLVGATSDDISLTFLPYAHILGRVEHWGSTFVGSQLAFAESIEKIRANLLEIRPTFMLAVPRIFEKVYSAIQTQLESNLVKKNLFKWALEIGLKAGEHRLQRKPLPIKLFAEYEIAKKLVLGKIKAAFGGRLRFAISGGAPLAKDISLFFHACEVLILEGYGLTETTAAICVNTPFDYQFGSVGKPIGDVKIKIAEDGEILVKSKKVMKEYYKDADSTKAALNDGWFQTGDIGEFTPHGDIKITDRKKDLIKTANGKYVAPQRLENLLKLSPLISNVLIHGDLKKYVIALITLDKANVINLAKTKAINYDDYSKLTQSPAVQDAIRKVVAEVNSQLANHESIKKFAILPQEFTVEAGELTPSLKVKRKLLDKKFSKEIEQLYN